MNNEADCHNDVIGAPKLGHQHKDDTGMFAKRCQLPVPSQCPEAPRDELKTDSCSTHDAVTESNAVVDNTSVDLPNELACGNQPKLTSSQVLPEFPTQSNAKEVVQECVPASSVMSDGSEPKTALVRTGQFLNCKKYSF